MQDFLLLIVVGATFLFGFFIMKKLDRFLENNAHTDTLPPQDEENSLKIGFSDPLIADSITDILDSFTMSKQDIPVYFFSGTADELLRKLSEHKLDVAFLPESVAVPEGTHYNIGEVSLAYIPVVTKYSGLEIEPITEARLLQKVVWEDTEKAFIVSDFIRCLKNKSGTDWRDKDGTAKAESGSTFTCDS